MPIAVFGKKVFQVSSKKVYTFDDFERSGTLETEAQETIGKRPATFIKFMGLETMSFSIKLDASLGVNVQQEYNWWINTRNSGKPQTFSIGGIPVTKNKWLLKSVAESDTIIDSRGKIKQTVLKLTFEEFVRAGTKPKDENNTPGKKSTTSKSKNNSKNKTKKDKKRNNPNAKKAKKKKKQSKSKKTQNVVDKLL